MFLAERRSLERFHLLLNYSGFLIVHYVCNFEAVGTTVKEENVVWYTWQKMDVV